MDILLVGVNLLSIAHIFFAVNVMATSREYTYTISETRHANRLLQLSSAY